MCTIKNYDSLYLTFQHFRYHETQIHSQVLLSLIFVVDRSVHCFNRFLAEPQAIEIKMSDGTNEIMPHFTFCSEEKYNRTVIEECGIKL